MLWEYSQTTKLISIMNKKVLFWPLAAVLLTACERGLDDGTFRLTADPDWDSVNGYTF